MRAVSIMVGVIVAALALPAVAQTAGSSRPAVQYYHSKNRHLPFSPVVRVGDVLYLSGQVGLRADGKRAQGIEAQARAALDNIKGELALAGADMDSVFKCTVFLADMSQWTDFNKVYVTYFKPDRLPARSAFGVTALALSAGVEVECMAYAGPAAIR